MTRLIRALQRWHLRSDLHYLEVYLRAVQAQPRPDEQHLRALRDQVAELHVRLAGLV